MDVLGSVDDLLDFSSDIGEDDDDDKPKKDIASLDPKCSDPPSLSPLGLDDPNQSFPAVEEELEWLSNKDAFPAVETFVDISCIQPDMSKYQKTTPMLENSTSSSNNSNNSSNSITLLSGYNQMKFPVRARSKSRSKPRLVDTLNQQFPWKQPSNKISREQPKQASNIGRKCHHCGADNTPQWRAGPDGPKTLCNACGVRYKSGRLVPEYRPANSPTFRRDVHSNSHRKVLEMRRQKGMG